MIGKQCGSNFASRKWEKNPVDANTLIGYLKNPVDANTIGVFNCTQKL